MKKHLLPSLLLAIGASVATAQPVLTATGINPVIGEQYTIKYGNYVSPGSAGANQTWNLTGINSTSTGNYTAASVASAPNGGAPFAPASNIQVNDGSVYSFLNVSATAYQNSGAIAGGVNFVYSDNEDIIHFPFNMNNTFTDPWAASFTSSSITFNRTGTTTVTYDGYGTLALPTGTYNNVARLHVVQNYQDASSFGNLNYTNDEYIWFINNFHQALGGVTSVSTTSSFTNMVTQTGFYSSNVTVPTSIQTENGNAASQVNIFPNPASEKINIALRSGLSIKNISLFDQLGKLVYNETLSADNQDPVATITLSDFANGVYQARIIASNGDVHTQKISVVKPN